MTPPSANVLLRQHWATRKRLVDEWHKAVWALCNYHRVYPANLHLDCTIYFRDNRKRDPANYVTPLDKLAFDGLVRCGILPDDSPEHLTWSPPVLAVDSKRPRTEVNLTAK